MARLRIYVDTSVIGGCFDAEFVTWSDALMRDFRAKRLVPVLSDVTAAEVAGAPVAVRSLHQELLGLSGGVLPVTPAVLTLVAAYEARGILPMKFADSELPSSSKTFRKACGTHASFTIFVTEDLARSDLSDGIQNENSKI